MAADRIIYKFVELEDVIAATPGANKLVYLTSASAIATTSFSSFGRSLVDDADAATARTTLGLGASSDVAFGTVTANSSTFDNVTVNDTLNAVTYNGDHISLTPASAVGLKIQPDDDTFAANYVTINNYLGAAVLALSNAGVLTANGSGLTSLNASNISSGTLNEARLPTTINGAKTCSATWTIPEIDGASTLILKGNVGNSIADGTAVISIGSAKYGRYWTIENTGILKCPSGGSLDLNATTLILDPGVGYAILQANSLASNAGVNIQLRADKSSGNAFNFNRHSGGPTSSLTASSGTQAWIAVDGRINQSGTAGYSLIYADVTEAATGSGSKYLLNLLVGGSTKLNVTNAGELTFNGGSTIKKVLTATATIDFTSIAAGATQEQTITVTGAATGDTVEIGLPSTFDAGLMATAYVSAADTVKIRLFNTTAGSIDPASATYRAKVTKF